MTVLQLYRQKKDELTRRLARSSGLYETCAVIQRTFESIIARYTLESGQDCRNFAARALELVNGALPAIETVRGRGIAEKSEKKTRRRGLGLAAAAAGFAVVFVSLGYYMFLYDISVREFSGWLWAVLAGCAIIFISGFLLFFSGRAKITVQLSTDINRMADTLESTAKAMDAFIRRRYGERQRRISAEAEKEDGELMRLLAYILEAGQSGRPDYMEEQMELVREYLSRKGVSALNYEKGLERYFDFLTGEDGHTFRPALVKNGIAIVRGLAGTNLP